MRLADEFVHVPGGSVLNNNVDIIVNIAQRCSVDAVWPVQTLSLRKTIPYPVFDAIPHSFFEPMSYRIGVK